MEDYIINNKLINVDKWHLYIDDLKKVNSITENNKEEAIKLLDEFLVKAIKLRVSNLDKFGIMFSGGLDCSVIAKICKDLGKKFICYTVGFEGSKDVIYARKAAKLMNLNLKIKIINEKELDNTLKNVVKILNSTNPVYVSIGCVTFAGLKFAKENNENVVLNGLGAEEIFCGYQRHLKDDGEKIHEESWRGLREMWKVDLIRDYLIAKDLDIEVRTPFMDRDLIVNAMKIDPSLKINKEMKKIILREYAKKIKVPEEIALRPKTAGQYGSGINQNIKKLTKQNKLNYVKEYLQNLENS